MNDKLLITGAGVDRTEGIAFPLANTLLTEINSYINNEGKNVDTALRDMLPGLRFSFSKMITNAVNHISTREPEEQRHTIEHVKSVMEQLETDDINYKHGKLIIKLFNKLAVIASESNLDDETYNLIREVFPNDADDMMDSDSILDIHKLSLSDTFKSVLKRTLKLGLEGGNPIATALSSDMLNIEVLLIDKFLGFYNNKLPDIKNYIYISWTLWAYLVHKQQLVLKKEHKIPFYSKIPKDVKGLTLNYTSFLENQISSENSIYFHGGLSEYVRMDTRELLKIENINIINPSEFITKYIKPNINVTDENINYQKYIIPSLIPPLRLKPILSHKYIDLWSKAAQWISNANTIVIVGYSFNSADEHFNDIIRVNASKKYFIIDPDATKQHFIMRIEKILGSPVNNFVDTTIQGFSSKKCRNVSLIACKADEINLEKLFTIE